MAGRKAGSRWAPSDSVRDRLVSAAQMRFLKFGVAGTGVVDICDDAGVTKGAFFHYFPSKDALVVEAVRQWAASGVRAFAAAPFWADPDPVQRVLGFVDYAAELTKNAGGPTGCLLGTVTQERGNVDRGICETCEDGFNEWLAPFRSSLDEALANRPPREPVDSKELLDFFLCVFEGAMILGKLRGDPSAVTNQLAHYRRYIELLFGLRGAGKSRTAARRSATA